jgi:hypothetical protein
LLPIFLLKNLKFWFLHTPTGESWAVDDPVAWCLKSAGEPILERAQKRLVTLDGSDPQRVIRLVVRRCRMNLLELRPGRVVVHHWGPQGQGDLRPFFKKHDLARQHVEAVLLDRKRETSTVRTGDHFLYGERLAEGFPLAVYREKWRRKATEEGDDWAPAQHGWSSYCWEGVGQRCVPWRVLKCLWRNENVPPCRNCDRPTLVYVFGMFVAGFYKLEPKVVRICPLCTSSFYEASGGPRWLLANLDKSLLPSAQMMFGHPVRYPLPWTAEGQVHERNLRVVNCLNKIEGRCSFTVETTAGRISYTGNRRTVTLPPFEGQADGLEDWCRRVIHLVSDEE